MSEQLLEGTVPELEDQDGGGGLVEIRDARHGVEVRNVSFPERMIELVVMPYETPTTVGHKGQWIEEIVSRGAFNGVQRRVNRIKVNRDHNPQRPVGRVTTLHPNRDEGLVAQLRISSTSEGNDTLELAADGVLDASAGFSLLHVNGKPKRDAEVWENRQRRRLNHLYLDHVAMVSNPAYPSASVISVRSADEVRPPVAMPNRGRLELERWLERKAEIDRRFL